MTKSISICTAYVNMISMESQKVIETLIDKYGEDRFTEIVLKIYTTGTITELNFSQEDIEEIVLPLVQLGLMKVENKYFRERPDEAKTHYSVFSISYKGEKFVESTLSKFDLLRRVEFFVNKYPSMFLAFTIHYFMQEGNYSGYEEKEYQKLLNTELVELLDNFKKDLEKLTCGFWIKEHTSKKAETHPPTLILLPDLVNSLGNRFPNEVIDREMGEFDLTNSIEKFFLKPQAKNEWYEGFLRTIDKDKLQNLWANWSEDLATENVLMGQVVLDASGLRAFLGKKIEKIQKTFVESAGVEKKISDFLRVLEAVNVTLDDNDKSDIMASCENRKDFSIFISAMYKILHDHMNKKDVDVIDPIRCYFHHGKQNKRQKFNKAQFKRFCGNCFVNFEPKDDEWKILKERILERATERIKERSAR